MDIKKPLLRGNKGGNISMKIVLFNDAVLRTSTTSRQINSLSLGRTFSSTRIEKRSPRTVFQPASGQHGFLPPS